MTAGPAQFGWRRRLIVVAAVAAVRLLYSTWRIRIVGSGGFERYRAKRQPLVFSLWHGELLPLVVHHRGDHVAVLISEHRDGESIARVATRLGMHTVRGSTTRGAMRALLGLVNALHEGYDIAVTPDGPRGPAHRVAPGILIAAQRAKAPIVTVAVRASRAWRLRSWDQFMIPKPFATVTFAYGDPVLVDAVNAREAGEALEWLEGLMHATAAYAETGSL